MHLRIFLLVLFIFNLSFSQDYDSLNSNVKDKKLKSWDILKSSVITIPSDFSQMGHGISDDWKRSAIYSVGILGLILTDKYTTEFYQDEIESRIDYSLPNISPKKDLPLFLDAFLSGNDTYITYSIVGLYGGSLLFKYEQGQFAAINSFKAIVYSYIISHLILKSIFARNRPDLTLSDGNPPDFPYTSDPYEFGNFHVPKFDREQEGTAFPSFHATAYFAVAKVMAMEFNNYWIPYSAISLLFLADIRGHKHWVSDLVAGGVVGTLIGSSIVKASRKWRDKKYNEKDEYGNSIHSNRKFKYQIVPQLSSNYVGLHLIGNF